MTEPRAPVDLAAVMLAAEGPPFAWWEVFGDDGPVEFEVGSGKGLFLVNAAAANPGHNYLGIEVAKKYARKAAERVARRGLANVRMLDCDVRPILANRIPSASLRAVHIYFPDPWWKARHKKRRVFSESFVDQVGRVLEPGGYLHVVTDVEEYYRVILDQMDRQSRFGSLPEPEVRSPEHELDYLTNFERKYRLEGRPIYRAAYRLTS